MKNDILKQNIEKAIAKNELEIACKMLINSTLKSEGQLIKGRLENIKRQNINGVLREGEYATELNKIRLSILELAKKLIQIESKISRNPLKGLHSFDIEDNDIFKELQRESEIRFFSEAIINDNFSFGLITGVSGVGKTSFIKAGLIPTIRFQNINCVYVKTSNISPSISISKSIQEYLKIVSNENSPIKKLAQQSRRKNVIILDQFEQFFIHNTNKKKRSLFIKELKEWYKSRDENSIKIIISIRSDMLYHLYELEEEIGYELRAKHNYFRLNKFTPLQAVEIFLTIAKTYSIEYDKSFLLKICEEELTSRDDELISAVDIQIVASMMLSNNNQNTKAFKLKPYKELGGIDGLLENYLREQLTLPLESNRKNLSLKILLALTNLDRNVRIGSLNIEQISKKLNNFFSTDKMEKTLKWLIDCRLVSKNIREDKSITFELAHERLIIPLRNVAGNKLKKADKISYILDKRVNEWLNNDKHRRYLLSINEIRNIMKYETFVSWEPKRKQKQDLVKASKRKLVRLSSVISAIIFTLIILSSFTKTQSWKNYLIYNYEINEVIKASRDDENKGKCARMIAPYDLKLSHKIINEINHNDTIISTYMDVRDTLIKYNLNYEQDVRPLDEILETKIRNTNNIKRFSYINRMLKGNIKLNNFNKIQDNLSKLNQIRIKEDSSIIKLELLSKQFYTVHLFDKKLAKTLFEEQEDISQENSVITNYFSLAKQANIMQLKGKTYKYLDLYGYESIENFELDNFLKLLLYVDIELNDEKQVLEYLKNLTAKVKKIDTSPQKISLKKQIISIIYELILSTNNDVYFKEILSIKSSLNSFDQTDVDLILGKAYIAINEIEKAISIFEKMYERFKGVNSPINPDFIFIAERLSFINKDETYLNLCREIVGSYTDKKLFEFDMLARGYANLGENTLKMEFLDSSKELIDQIGADDFRAYSYANLAQVSARTSTKIKDIVFFDFSKKIVKLVPSGNAHNKATSTLIEASCKLGLWKETILLIKSLDKPYQINGYIHYIINFKYFKRKDIKN